MIDQTVPKRFKAHMARNILFYDGECGLCHRLVSWAVAHDRAALFDFAPLAGETFRSLVPEAEQETRPDSVIIRSADGALFYRASAVLFLLQKLGGGWACLAKFASRLPLCTLDFAYDCVARVRSRIFARPPTSCPIVPPELRVRFRA